MKGGVHEIFVDEARENEDAYGRDPMNDCVRGLRPVITNRSRHGLEDELDPRVSESTTRDPNVDEQFFLRGAYI